jgi:hypothetical protein
MRRLLLLLTIICLTASVTEARIKTVGKGDKLNFDPAMIPPNWKPAFDILELRCIKCHSMERSVIAISTGIAPVTGQPFDKQATKSYGIKMLRKPKSGMNRDEVKQVIGLMNWLLDEAHK